ncbi:MAG: polysaccharide deacetylase family protein [Candidatus Syntrophonatronum acetioxidans]|uniref:Polysaccharide deacetylase family protein n=1 Tax=Candidatus Syntrophonatronum acetioxidans TaxID=1795816 RepID=A0A424YD84_9FIRM|nr:MAG: polysaccharide deacetylase family protein [Candidatus Syntrophonatronum acetioxidans]
MIYNLKLNARNIKKGIIIIIILALIWAALSYQIIQGVISPVKENVIYRVDTDKNLISLTFDVVWSDEYTKDLLKILERYRLKTTFFVTGKWIEKYPELTEEILKQGHEIGNHTYSHANLKSLSEEEIREEIERVDKLLLEKFDYKSEFFRPPFGEYDDKVVDVAQNMGYYTVLWSIETGDWLSPGVDKIIDKVVKRAHRGGIILMHNCYPQGIKALPAVIHAMKLKRFTITPVSELIKEVENKEDNKNDEREIMGNNLEESS